MKRYRSYVVFACFLSLLAYLFVISADDGASDFAKIEKSTRNVNQRNTDLDSAVLSMRLGLVEDYDALTRCEQELSRSFVRVGHGGDARLEGLLETKTLLVSDFKACHSITRIAEAGFRRHAQASLAEAKNEKSELLRLIVDLEIQGSRFVATGRGEDRVEFELAIQNLEEVVSKFADTIERSKCLHLALRHAKLLISRRTKLDEVIAILIAVPVRQETSRIVDKAAAQYRGKVAEVRWYRTALVAMVLALVGFCVYQYLGLYKHRAALSESNRNLEQRVAERTSELASANGELQATIAEAEKLALVARYTDNAVIITDVEGRIEWVNEGFERITEYSLEDALGARPVDLLNGPDTDAAAIKVVEDAIANKVSYDLEMLRYRKSDEAFWMAIEARPILDKDGSANRFILVGSDITKRAESERERQRLNERLIDASRAAGVAEVATGVLHNVGNVLNSVNVSASVINKQLQQSALQKLERVATLIETHVDDFGTFVRDDSRGKRIPNYVVEVTKALRKESSRVSEEFDDMLDNIEHIKEIVAVQQGMAKSKGMYQTLTAMEVISAATKANKGSLANHDVELNCDVPDDLPEFISDKHKVLQILVNLITNAKDAIVESEKAERRIDICASVKDGFLAFEVIDNGVGIAVEDMNKVFQHGFTTKVDGHGFGLHCSANAATEMGGALTVMSAGVGEGATFSLQLPVEVVTPCVARKNTLMGAM